MAQATNPQSAGTRVVKAPIDRGLTIDDSDLLLQRAFRWEKEKADTVWMVQPMGGGKVEEYTWKRALDESRRMATYLASLSLPKGSKIAILSKNCAHFIMTELAIWMAGHVSVALYPTLAPDTIRYILEHSESQLLFVGKLDGWEGMKPGVPATMACVSYPLSPKNDYPTWNDIVRKHEPMPGQPVRDADDTATLMYTSGSTGRAKGVEHGFRALSVPAKGFDMIVGYRPDDRMISYLPLAHAFERAVVQAASLYHGFQIFFAEALDTFVQDLQRARPTVFHSVPRLWLKFQAGVNAKMPQKKLNTLLSIPIVSGIVRKKVLKNLGLDQVRVGMTGSAPIPAELLNWYRSLGLELLEGYGMTENFCYSNVSYPGAVKVGSVGQPTPGVECRIGENQEIQMRGPAMMKGYYKQPDVTAESFTEDGWFRTGDRGEFDAEGRLTITGRVKELFKTSKGKYVSPAPIENKLNASGIVEQSCVMGANQPQPFAVVMLGLNHRPMLADDAGRMEIEKLLESLRHEVNKDLDPHEHLELLAVAKEEWLIENGLLTPTMKIQRQSIENRYGDHVEKWYGAGKVVQFEP